MATKFVSLKEAAALVGDGSKLVISGNMEMSPIALIFELIRARRRDLHLVCAGAAAINADVLIGAGAVRTLEFSQITLGEFGFALRFRKRLEEGALETLEHACPSVTAALQAGAMGVPFIPVRGLLGTDYMHIRSDFKELRNPYDEQESIAVVPGIRPDTAVFHAFKADTNGNVVALASQNNRLLAQAARQTIVTVEEIVTPEALLLEAGGDTWIPAIYITAVVLAPSGAWPTSCPGRYGIDASHVQAYAAASRSDDGFAAYLERYVLGSEAESEAALRGAAGKELPR